MIRLKGITKVYRAGDVLVPALRGIDLHIQQGEFIAIMGHSGSGKSTLMNILGCLDQPSGGIYELEGLDVSTLGEERLAAIRNHKVGFVFQSFNLLPRISAIEQVELPLLYRRTDNRRHLAIQALVDVGLGNRIGDTPGDSSRAKELACISLDRN